MLLDGTQRYQAMSGNYELNCGLRLKGSTSLRLCTDQQPYEDGKWHVVIATVPAAAAAIAAAGHLDTSPGQQSGEQRRLDKIANHVCVGLCWSLLTLLRHHNIHSSAK